MLPGVHEWRITVPQRHGDEGGAPGARWKIRTVAVLVDNLARIVSVELLCATQAMDFSRPPKGGTGSETAYASVRRLVPFIEEDQVLSVHLEKLETLVRSGDMVTEVEAKLGDLLSE